MAGRGWGPKVKVKKNRPGATFRRWPEVIFSRRAKNFPFSPGANLGGFGLLENGGNSAFETMDQAGVFPMISELCGGFLPCHGRRVRSNAAL